MKFTGCFVRSFLVLLSVTTVSFAAPTPAPGNDILHTLSAEDLAMEGEYLALFDVNDKRSFEEIFAEMGATTSTIYQTFDNGVFRGFIGNMSHHCVKQMGVMSVVTNFEKDSEFQAKTLVEQSDAPWGLQRISSGGPIQNPPNALADVTARAFSYQFDDSVQGEGVDVYVIDSGVK